MEKSAADSAYALPLLMDNGVCLELRLSLMEHIMQQHRPVLNAMQVERLSTLAIQVLLSALQTAKAADKEIILKAPPLMHAIIEDLGLGAAFESHIEKEKIHE